MSFNLIYVNDMHVNDCTKALHFSLATEFEK